MPAPERSDGVQQRPAGAATAATDDTEFTSVSALTMETDGAALHLGAARSILDDLEMALADVPGDQAGVRLYDRDPLSALTIDGPIADTARRYLGAGAKAVRAVLFDKSPTTNWSLGWHQDRTIVVRERRDVAGFGPWTRKAGRIHVEPPFAVIARMATLRIHLDDVPADNAPLRIAPGSHRLGRIAEDEVAGVVDRLGERTCLARRGDIWSYATPILHASSASHGHDRRRVLQIDYSVYALPGNLAWQGV